MEFKRPPRLKAGDRVAVVTPSWGGPSVHPNVYAAGIHALESLLALQAVEYPCTHQTPEWLSQHPEARAEDINSAFADPSISAIVATIGGSDSSRILAHIDTQLIVENPKILLGFSDTTTILTQANQAGIVTFNGPSLMAGIAQLGRLPHWLEHVRQLLFDPSPRYRYKPFAQSAADYPDWDNDGAHGEVAQLFDNDVWHWVNGTGVHRGQLFGGCVDVLEFLKGTRFWPPPSFWNKKLLFLETSEDNPSPTQVRDWLFNYGIQGVFDQINGLLVGRPHGYSPAQIDELDQMILSTVVGQFGAIELPILTNLDFGHTYPQWILPLGVLAEIDFDKGGLQLLESPVA